MTTIVIAEGTVVWDSQLTIDGRMKHPAPFQKFVRRKGRWIGLVGTLSAWEPLIQWVLKGADPDAKLPTDEWSIIVIDKKYRVRCASNEDPRLSDVTQPMCFGTGGSFAYAALALGNTPLKAVEVACQLDIYSSAPINRRTIAEMADELHNEADPEEEDDED